MKLNTFLAAAALCLPLIAQAGFNGPSSSTVNNAAEASKAADDTYVVLEGFVVKQLAPETYEFKDSTATIKVEIDNKEWPSQEVTPKTKVRLTGKVDRSKVSGFKEVEVKKVEIIQ